MHIKALTVYQQNCSDEPFTVTQDERTTIIPNLSISKSDL